MDLIYYCPACHNENESHAAECRVCGYEFRGEHDDEPQGVLSPAERQAQHLAEFGR